MATDCFEKDIGQRLLQNKLIRAIGEERRILNANLLYPKLSLPCYPPKGTPVAHSVQSSKQKSKKKASDRRRSLFYFPKIGEMDRKHSKVIPEQSKPELAVRRSSIVDEVELRLPMINRPSIQEDSMCSDYTAPDTKVKAPRPSLFEPKYVVQPLDQKKVFAFGRYTVVDQPKSRKPKSKSKKKTLIVKAAGIRDKKQKRLPTYVLKTGPSKQVDLHAVYLAEKTSYEKIEDKLKKMQISHKSEVLERALVGEDNLRTYTEEESEMRKLSLRNAIYRPSYYNHYFI